MWKNYTVYFFQVEFFRVDSFLCEFFNAGVIFIFFEVV